LVPARPLNVGLTPPLKSLYRELLAEAQRVNPTTAATLRPGLSRDVVRKKLATLPYEITPGAASLYEWADGADGPFELLPGAYFIPLTQAMDQFKVFHKLAQQMDEEEEPHRDCFRFRHFPDRHPILLADVLVDLNDAAGVQAIAAGFLAPRDPELRAPLHIEVVRL
jgi:hypothetical protein